jgi:hypothetical protein
METDVTSLAKMFNGRRIEVADALFRLSKS